MGDRDGFRDGEFCWIDLSSRGLDEAKAFYGALFGWEALDGDTGDGPPYATFLQDGKAVAGLGVLSDEMQAQGVPSTWNTYVQADDVDAVVAEVLEHGGTVPVPAMDVMAYGRMAFVTDPGGAMLGLWQPGTHRGCQLVNAHGAWVWAELNSWVPDEAAAFFEAVFGWQFAPNPEMDGYRMISAHDRSCGGILTMNEQWGDMPSSWSVYFHVDDVDAAVAKLKELGGAVLVPPFVMGEVGRGTVVADPHGAHFTMLQTTRLDP